MSENKQAQLKELEDMIINGRESFPIDALTDPSLWVLKGTYEDHEDEDIKIKYHQSKILGSGLTIENAVDCFRCQYYLSSRTRGGVIYWHNTPLYETERLFDYDGIIHLIMARFLVRKEE